jgi:hypothetical protein
MHVLAAFFDPNNNGFDLTDLITPLAFVLASVGAWIGVDKWRDEKRATARADLVDTIRDVVQDATKDAQPRNGGSGWTDVAQGVRELKANQVGIKDQITGLETRLTARMDHSDVVRTEIMRQQAEDRAAWVDLLTAQGIEVPNVNPVKYDAD